MTGSEGFFRFLRFGAPRLYKRTWLALLLLAVGAVVGGVPGCQEWLASWMVLSWFLLAGVVVVSLALALGHAATGLWAEVRVDASQIFYAVLAGAILPAMFALSPWVELVATHDRLEREAAASVRAGGARVSATHVHDLWSDGGTVYDPDGEILKPVQERSERWQHTSPVPYWLDRDCVDVRHLVGAFYRWSNGCGTW